MASHPPIDSQITFLYTHDLAETARFYEDVFGLTLWRDQTTCRIYQVTSEAYLGICERETVPDPPAGPGSDRLILTIVTEDVDSWYEMLSARGVSFAKAPAINPAYNIYHCFCRDPNGYLIEIQSFLD